MLAIVEKEFNIQIPKFQESLLSRDKLTQENLPAQLWAVLEKFFGPEHVYSAPLSRLPIAVPLWNGSPSSSTKIDEETQKYQEASIANALDSLERTCSEQTSLLRDCKCRGFGITGNPDVTGAIRTWWQSPASSVLCIRDTSPEFFGDANVAQQLVGMARETDTRLVVYFCSKIDHDGFPREQRGQFIELLRYVIFQLWASIDDQAKSIFFELDKEMLSSLDSTMESTDLALDIINDLIYVGGSPVLLVIDMLENLRCTDDKVLENGYQKFFNKLQDQERAATLKVILRMEEKSVVAAKAANLGMFVDASLSDSSEGWFSLEDFKSGLNLYAGLQNGSK